MDPRENSIISCTEALAKTIIAEVLKEMLPDGYTARVIVRIETSDSINVSIEAGIGPERQVFFRQGECHERNKESNFHG